MIVVLRDWQPNLTDQETAAEYLLLINQASTSAVSFTAWNCFRIEQSAYINVRLLECPIMMMRHSVTLSISRNFVQRQFFLFSGVGDYLQLRANAATISTGLESFMRSAYHMTEWTLCYCWSFLALYSSVSNPIHEPLHPTGCFTQNIFSISFFFTFSFLRFFLFYKMMLAEKLLLYFPVTFCIHSGIIPVGQFSRKRAKSINQA